jgi:hypothetical protein
MVLNIILFICNNFHFKIPPRYNWSIVESGVKERFVTVQAQWSASIVFLYIYNTSVDTEMCCPKGKCACQYFILLTLNIKKKIKNQLSNELAFLL